MTLPWSEVPAEEKARLIAREKTHRRETAKKGLKAESVSVEALWMLQRGFCGCHDGEACGPLNPHAKHGDPDHIVIGHDEARRFEAGHTRRNVILQRADCNQKQSGQENSWQRRQTKFIPDPEREPTRAKPKRGHGSIPKPKVSALSKDHKFYRKQKIGSKGFER